MRQPRATVGDDGARHGTRGHARFLRFGYGFCHPEGGGLACRAKHGLAKRPRRSRESRPEQGRVQLPPWRESAPAATVLRCIGLEGGSWRGHSGALLRGVPAAHADVPAAPRPAPPRDVPAALRSAQGNGCRLE